MTENSPGSVLQSRNAYFPTPHKLVPCKFNQTDTLCYNKDHDVDRISKQEKNMGQWDGNIIMSGLALHSKVSFCVRISWKDFICHYLRQSGFAPTMNEHNYPHIQQGL